MNTKPLSEARDADLRLSKIALERAAQRARELAAATGTELIVSRDGMIERIPANAPPVSRNIQEPDAPYGKKP